MRNFPSICNAIIPAAYIIYIDEQKIKAVNGITGAVDYSGTDATSVIQSAVNAVNPGDTIFLKPGQYILLDKLSLKNINFIGSGLATELYLANNVNKDMIEIYSGATDSNKVYLNFGRISNMKLSGNRNNQTSGSGIVLAWVTQFVLENLYLYNIKEYALKTLRCFWNSFQNISIRTYYDGANGIKIGEYDIIGRYNGGVGPYDLMSQQNIFNNVQISGDSGIITAGFLFESGDHNTLICCDTSGCTTGVLLRPASATAVRQIDIIDHWFESNTTALKMVDHDAVYNVRDTRITNPFFWGNGTKIDNIGSTGKVYGLENSVLSDPFPVNPAGTKTVTIVHGLVITPSVQECCLTVIQDTPVDDWTFNSLKIVSTDSKNVTAKINVMTASATIGAKARLALRAGNP